MTKESRGDDQPAQRLMEAMQLELNWLDPIGGERIDILLSALLPRDNNLKDHPFQLLKSTSDLNTMYLNDYMKKPDQEEFITVMVK